MDCPVCAKPFEVRAGTRPREYCSPGCATKASLERAKADFTGKCQQCSQPVPFPRRFCSYRCRDGAMRTGRTMAQYTCAFCGKEVKRASFLARKQKYCSLACMRRDQVPDVQPATLEPSFGHWLAGLTDGEGCFMLQATNAIFQISLRADDSPLLRQLRDIMGFGKLYHSRGRRQNENDCLVYSVASTKACWAIVAIFRQYPLRSKKARDFELWARAVDLMRTGQATPQALAALRDEITSVRKYLAPK